MKPKPKERVRPWASALGRKHRIAALGVALALVVSPASAQPDGTIDASEILAPYLWPALGAILFLVLLNAMFVAVETAADLLSSSHLKAFDREDRRAAMIQDYIHRRKQYVAACTLGSHTLRAWMIMFSLVPSPSLARFLEDRFHVAPGWPAILLAFSIITIPVAAFNLVFGELIPKSYAVVHPIGTALRLNKFARMIPFAFSVPSKFLTLLASLVAHRFGGKPSFGIVNEAEEQIKSLAETAGQSGEIEAEERELLHSVFEFGDTVVREVMTPRVDMDAVSLVTPLEDAIELIQESGHSRLPVYEGTDDQIVGIVHAKDLLLAKLRNGRAVEIRELMRPALFVPENKNLHELLQELRQGRVQMAIVQDEFGGTAGIVTIEDIVEELVGDIVDEYDLEEPKVILNGKGYIVDGKVNLYDLNDEIGSAFESDEFDTIGGYVFGLFGRQPRQGESLDADGYRFTVDDTDGRRIMKLHVCPVGDAEGVS